MRPLLLLLIVNFGIESEMKRNRMLWPCRLSLLQTTLEKCRTIFKPFPRQLASALASLVVVGSIQPGSVEAYDYRIDSTQFQKSIFNVPSDDFWYPPYMIGRWQTSMKFSGAVFTKSIPSEELFKEKINVPGASRYSVIFLPVMGKDINVEMRYVQLDSHPREDHPRNIKSLVSSFIPDAVVDSAPYHFQKAPDWFHSPANHWEISYHDADGSGNVELSTRKRRIEVFAGTIDTTEYFTQKHTRLEKGTAKETVSYSDYALNWKLSLPESRRDEFVTTENLSKAQKLVGTLDVLVYLQPSNDLYKRWPSKPVGVFTYEVEMNKLGTETPDTVREEVKRTLYPFVWRDVGPVELDEYFGY